MDGSALKEEEALLQTIIDSIPDVDSTNAYMEKKAGALGDLGALYEASGYFAKAEKAWLQARKIYGNLLERDQGISFLSLTTLLHRLGNLYIKRNNFLLAKEALEEAIVRATRGEGIDEDTVGIVSMRAQPGQDWAVDEDELAELLADMGRLYLAIGDLVGAEKKLQQSVGMLEDMGHAGPRVYAPQLAAALKSMGDLQHKKGLLLQERGFYERAIRLYEELVVDGVTDLEHEGLGRFGLTLICYGLLYLHEGDIEGAKGIFFRARAMYEPLAAANSFLYDDDFSIVLSCIEAISSEERNRVAADEALQRMGQLQVIHTLFSPIQGPVCGTVLLNLGAGYKRKEDFPASRESYLRALEIYERLEVINPGDQQVNMADVMHSLGSLYRDFGHLREAEVKLNRAMDIRKKLSLEYPFIYEPELGKTTHSLGKLYIRMEEKRQAIFMLGEAAAIYERLVLTDPIRYELELSQIYLNLGPCLMEKRERALAKEVYEKAQLIVDKLAESNPVRHESDRIFILQNLAHLYVYKNEFREAEEKFKQALAIKLTNGIESKPDKVVANIYRYMGKMFFREGDLNKAEDALTNAWQEYNRLETLQQGMYDAKKKEILHLLLDIYGERKEEELSIPSLEKRLVVYEALDELRVGEYRAVIAENLTQLAGEYADMDRPEDAEFVRLKANTIYEDLIGGGAMEYRPALAESLFWLAILQEHKNDKGSANMNYRYCLELYDMIVEEEGPIYHSKLANILMYYGKFLMRHGQGDMGNEYIRRAVEIARSSVN